MNVRTRETIAKLRNSNTLQVHLLYDPGFHVGKDSIKRGGNSNKHFYSPTSIITTLHLKSGPTPSPIHHTSYTLELGTHVLTNASLLGLTTTDNTTVDGAGHAVLLLDVQLGESVLYALTTTIAKTTLVDGSVANISLRRGIHNVSHLETLHGLILRPHAKRNSALPYRRNDSSGCSGRDSHDLFPSWNDRDFFKTVNRHSQQHHDHHLTHAQNKYLPTLERHSFRL